ERHERNLPLGAVEMGAQQALLHVRTVEGDHVGICRGRDTRFLGGSCAANMNRPSAAGSKRESGVTATIDSMEKCSSFHGRGKDCLEPRTASRRPVLDRGWVDVVLPLRLKEPMTRATTR